MRQIPAKSKYTGKREQSPKFHSSHMTEILVVDINSKSKNIPLMTDDSRVKSCFLSCDCSLTKSGLKWWETRFMSQFTVSKPEVEYEPVTSPVYLRPKVKSSRPFSMAGRVDWKTPWQPFPGLRFQSSDPRSARSLWVSILTRIQEEMIYLCSENMNTIFKNLSGTGVE